MSYQKKPKQLGPSPEANTTAPSAPVTPPTILPQPKNVAGGAPQYKQAQPWGNATPAPTPKFPMPSPLDVNDVAAKMGPFVQALKETLQARAGNQQSPFWNGFNEYPEAMAKLIARRMMTNQLEAEVIAEEQGNVGKWMTWLQGREAMLLQPEQPEYGDGVKKEAMVAANPLPKEEAGTVEPEVIAQEAAAPPEQQGETEAQPPFAQPTSLMQRIPHRYDKLGMTQQKAVTDQLYDVGRLWSVLSVDPRVDPTVQTIAKRLMREQ